MHRNRISRTALVACLLASGLMSASTTIVAADDPAVESLRVEDPMQPVWLRKRTTKQPSRPAARTRFTVDTIVVSPDRRIAVINGRSVGIGNTVDGARVLDIEPDRVTLDVGGNKLMIELTISNIKTVTKDGG